MRYANGADVLDNDAATQVFQESITSLDSSVGQNEVTYGAGQQQSAVQAQMATNMQVG